MQILYHDKLAKNYINSRQALRVINIFLFKSTILTI